VFNNIGATEILLLLLLALLLFGAKRLPEIGRSFGNAIREFKKSVKEAQADVEPGPPETKPRNSEAQKPPSIG
jgi:sec-independent protein translocase protein TatA